MTMKITATGDALIHQGIPEGGYEGFDEIKAFIARGDARLGNLETTVTDGKTYASAYCGGTWLSCRPRALDQYLLYGADFVGIANNHAMDFGPDGLKQTLENLKKRGIACPGAGNDLNEASEAKYRTYKSGRVGVIAITASFNDAARAGYPSRTTIGRPGVNALRKKYTLKVNGEHFRAISEIVANTKVNGSHDICVKDGFYLPSPEGTVKLGDYLFVRSDGKEEKITSCNKYDLERTARTLKDASYIADYRVVMLHDHIIKGDVMSEPDDGGIEFAHFCIDHGADAVIGTGVHQFKPVEIYKNKPIFYSLGNFIFQSNVVETQPYDLIEKNGFEETITDIQALAKRNRDWTTGLHVNQKNFLTVIPYLEYDGEKLIKAELKPVELGFEKSRTFKGIPYPADEKQTKLIFDTLSSISEPFGTRFVLRSDGIIEIVL